MKMELNKLFRQFGFVRELLSEYQVHEMKSRASHYHSSVHNGRNTLQNGTRVRVLQAIIQIEFMYKCAAYT